MEIKCKGRGCDKVDCETIEVRYDWYGVYSGHFCDDCYENNYQYREDRYVTEEYNGYDERLGV